MYDYVFSCKNLNLYYDNGAKHALKNVNIDISKNKVTAFIGPSGCGKSTLLRCFDRMNDLVDGCKIEGEILFNGQDINEINTIQLRTKVGMVFQQPNPFPMSIRNNVTYGPKCQGERNRATLDKLVEESLKDAAIYEEVKDEGDYEEGSAKGIAVNAFVDFMGSKEGLTAIKAAGGIISGLSNAKSWASIQTAKYPELAA